MDKNDPEPTLQMTDDRTDRTPTLPMTRPNYNFKSFNLNQQLLIAPDLNDWLPDGHLVRAIAATVEVMDENGDLDRFYAGYRENGQSSWSYHPKMMVGIIIYGWCVGVVTTRKIARAIENDVGFRYLAGNQLPDFRTIGYFIRKHEDGLEGLFDVVLRMCMEAGMTKVGRVALDGRFVQGNASIDRNRSADNIAKQVKSIVEEMRRLEADEDEQFGDRRGDELPDDLQDPEQRKRVMEEARKRLDAKHDASYDVGDSESNSPKGAPDRLFSKLENLLRSHDLLDEREQEWEEGIRKEQREKIEQWEKREGGRRGKRPMSPDEKVKREREARYKGRKQAPASPDPDPMESDAEWEERVRREQQEMIDQRNDKQKRSGKKPRGRSPLSPAEKVKRERPKREKQNRKREKAINNQDEQSFDRKNAKINLTDPDTRPMKGRRGWKQGFNDQTMVDPDSQIITGTDTVSDTNDKGQLNPMLESCKESSGKYPDETITDAGYYSEEADRLATEKTELFSSTQKGWRTRKQLREQPSPRGRIPMSATLTDRMERKLLTKNGRKMYKKRSVVECVQGQLANRGFVRFFRRGQKKARMESSLWKSTNNILKMFRAGKLPGTA